MYERHWQLKHAPFGNHRRVDEFFAAETHHDAILKLRYLIEHRRGAGLLVGASGTGKTHLLDVLLQPSDSAAGPVVNVFYPQMSPQELLGYIATKLGGESPVSTGRTMDAVVASLENRLLALTAENRPPVIVIDDAHAISERHVLQSLQLLLNFQQPDRMDFTLILAGQPELVGVVKRLPQLGDRIAMPCVLRSFTPVETTHYIEHRLQAAGAREPIFTEAALVAIHELSGGLPRRVNRLADFALLVGYAEELTRIDAEQIEGVHAELSLGRAA